MPNFRETCTSGAPLFGTFCAIPHPVAMEVTAAAGLDFVCIDWEHAQIGREKLEELVRAADLHRVPAMVRVPDHAREWTAFALDAGASGVLVPRVSTAGQARAAVLATRYPPLGERGVGPGRASGYGYRIGSYLANANDALTLAIQIETAEGLANIHEIVEVAGVDLIFIGPGDLSVSLGIKQDERETLLLDAITRISAASRAAGKTVGIFVGSADSVSQWRNLDISFFMLGSDTVFLGSAVSQCAEQLKSATVSSRRMSDRVGGLSSSS